MILVAVLPAILLLFLGHPIHGDQPVEPLKRLDNLVTTRIKEILKKDANSSIAGILERYKKLQEAADWPFAQLDEKIKAYNSYKSYEDSTTVDYITDSIEPSNVALRKGNLVQKVSQSTKDAKIFQRRVVRILRRLGIYNPTGKRVWQAIFSNEKNLKKLKKKLDAIDDSKEDDSDDDDNLWDFIFSFWY
ncbi:uncharacterized protein LOC111082901 [Drosophila obscura]|uniref:uncharacterized protein LOC111082901 n=1 Tax=Drosophila obscura TaxID=7282 RepID=UPI001BB1EE30|nr:uncharacterized protein LOC111082901 [Drosophila obscura]